MAGCGHMGVLASAVAVGVVAAALCSTASSRAVGAARGWRRADLTAVTQPVAVGDRFVFYAARRGGLQIVALDARTGRTLWAAPATQSNIAPGQPPNLAVIGSVVFYLGKRGSTGPLGELVARDVNNGRVRWRSALRSVFTLPGASSDWGWNFDRANRVSLFVGSPGWKPVKMTPTHFVADLSRAMTAGFRIDDGAVVWRSRGMYLCNYLVCPGGSQAGFSGPSNAAG